MRSSQQAEKANSRRIEFAFTDDDFVKISTTLHDEAGIHLPKSKSTLVYARIAKRLRHLGMDSFKQYCALIESKAGIGERSAMIAALTTNVTRFFREPHHFDHLKTKLLPKLIQSARKGKPVRIWSAGCSSGQEPYSIALTLLSMLPDARGYDIKILATDINANVIAAGQAGRFSADDLSDVPRALRDQWIDRIETNDDQLYEVDDAVKGLVTFRELNLMERWPMSGTFDIIFCRNVVIYFDEKTQFKIWNRMNELLKPGGVLYLGHSERLNGPAAEQFDLEGTTTYRKR
jgi:chemotaxis protein methyltransferase CheR